MLSVSCRIWTRVAVSISYDDNDYTTGTSWTRLDELGDPPVIVPEIEIWPYELVIYAQPRIRPREWDAQSSIGIWDTNRWPNLCQTTRRSNS